MKFQKGHKMQKAAGVPKKLFDEQLRYLVMQPTGIKGSLGKPKKMTALQSICISAINEAIKGNMVAFKEIVERIDGKVPLLPMGAADDAAPPESRDITLKEMARRIGFVLMSQLPDEVHSAH